MKKRVIFLVLVILVFISCSTYRHFHPKQLRGESRVIQKLPNGNYLVTAGYVRKYWDSCVSQLKHESPCLAKILNLLVSENPDRTWEVKPEMVEQARVK